MRKWIALSIAVSFALAMIPCAFANNVSVGTPVIPPGTHLIQFDLSWDHSWRNETNWDAVWVFVKYKKESESTWNQVYLDTRACKHQIPSNYTCAAGITGSYGMGVFIYRDNDGSGTSNLTGVKLKWNYAANGLSAGHNVTVKVFAIEMVYIPQGNLNLNTATSGNMLNEFTNVGITSILSETAIAEDAIVWNVDDLNGGQGNSDALGASYPKGYNAFYCMKYEISQEQYADFLSCLTDAQDHNRYPAQNGNYRHTISGSYGNYSASAPNRACNYLNWIDGCAYSDWAALRPMTELEFEKAGRGNQSAIADEFAWGNTSITAATTISGIENGTETITNANANCCYNDQSFAGGDGGTGPLRCGIFATNSTERESAGAGYYGVMELSGNLWERCVTIADRNQKNTVTDAGLFDGSHGDGTLSNSGYATNSNWPGSDAIGSGFRGGDWRNVASHVRLSARDHAAYTFTIRNCNFGFRSVRSVP
jgi:formylglycine-generating enzyme required for sulfatase activity